MSKYNRPGQKIKLKSVRQDEGTACVRNRIYGTVCDLRYDRDRCVQGNL